MAELVTDKNSLILSLWEVVSTSLKPTLVKEFLNLNYDYDLSVDGTSLSFNYKSSIVKLDSNKVILNLDKAQSYLIKKFKSIDIKVSEVPVIDEIQPSISDDDLLERLKYTQTEDDVALIFEGDFAELKNFINRNNNKYKMESELKEFIKEILTEPFEPSWKMGI